MPRNDDGGPVRCRECGQTCPDMHALVDHLSDDHELYDWVTKGRPIARADGGTP